MTKATSVITSKFRKTYVVLKDTPDEELQKAMFALGFRWAHGRLSARGRDVFDEVQTYISVDEDYYLFYSSTPGSTPNDFRNITGGGYREVSRSVMLDAAEAVRQIKRHESKLSKKRRAQRKWDATATKRTTEVCPVRRDVVIAAKLVDGDVITERAGWFDWTTDEDGYTSADIESYKVLTPNKHKPKPEQTVSLEDMVFDVAADIGKGVAIPVHDFDGEFVEVPEVDATVAQVGDVNSNARGSGARFNAGKPDYSLIPMTLLEGEARVWAYGASKYKAWNWMKGMDWSVPFACAMRHMAAWQRGEDIDPETGESHLDHAMCNLRMLRYYTDFYKEGDDRPKEFFVKEDK